MQQKRLTRLDVHQNIKLLVDEYKRVFADEFASFLVAMRPKRNAQTNKFSEIKGNDFIVRALYEIPETLSTILLLKLSDDDYKWLRTKEGGRWFAKSFKEFRLSEKV